MLKIINKSLAYIGLVLLIVFSSPNEASVTNELVNTPKNYESYTIIDTNNDGTYSIFMETSQKNGHWAGGTQYTPENYRTHLKYSKSPADIKISKYVEALGADVIAPIESRYPNKIGMPNYFEDYDPTSSVDPYAYRANVSTSNPNLYKWNLHLGIYPIHFREFFPGFKMPINTLNSLELKFKVKPNYYGTIIPIDEAKNFATNKGLPNESGYSWFYLNAVHVPMPSNLQISSEFYEDEGLTNAINETDKNNVYIKYTIENPNDVDISDIKFVQDANLINNIRIKNSTTGTTYTNDIINLIPKNSKVELIGNVDLSNYGYPVLENNSEIQINLTKVSSKILDEDIFGKTGYTPLKTRAQIGDDTSQPGHTSHPFYGNNPNGKTKFLYLSDNEEKIVPLVAKSKSGLKLYATLSFDANGGTNPPAPITTTRGSVVIEPAKIPTKQGYTFEGWGTSTASATTLHDFNAPLNTNTTVYATWKKIPAEKVTLSFDANGGTNPPAPITTTKGSVVIEPNDIPTKQGYIFEGWSTSINGTTLHDFNVPLDIDTTVYATWQKVLLGTINNVTLSFDANGGTNPPAPITTTRGSVVIKPSGIPTRDGYNFKGWSTSRNGTILHDFGNPLNIDKTVYAIWEKNRN